MALADVYDALISKRCYKAAMSTRRGGADHTGGTGNHSTPTSRTPLPASTSSSTDRPALQRRQGRAGESITRLGGGGQQIGEAVETAPSPPPDGQGMQEHGAVPGQGVELPVLAAGDPPGGQGGQQAGPNSLTT